MKCGPTLQPANGLFFKKEVQAVCCTFHAAQAQAKQIEEFARWTLTKITPVSRHSALYHFTSTDSSRGTPYIRGRGRTIWHKTWRTTLRTDAVEGELPSVEKDFTPISTWMEWDHGECILLINPSEAAAVDLHTQQPGSDVWLSKPKKSLSVPSLVPDVTQVDLWDHPKMLEHKGVLLVLGGAGGIPLVAQVLQHTDPATCFGSGDRPCVAPLRSPVHVVYVCERDDVLMARELGRWCAAKDSNSAQLQRLVLAISAPQEDRAAAFPQTEAEKGDGWMELETLDNVRVLQGATASELLTSELLQAEMAPLHALGCCRVVVSGPAGFNLTVAEMLESQCQVDPNAITILAA